MFTQTTKITIKINILASTPMHDNVLFIISAPRSAVKLSITLKT